jgi:hypothetical protein
LGWIPNMLLVEFLIRKRVIWKMKAVCYWCQLEMNNRF